MTCVTGIMSGTYSSTQQTGKGTTTQSTGKLFSIPHVHGSELEKWCHHRGISLFGIIQAYMESARNGREAPAAQQNIDFPTF